MDISFSKVKALDSNGALTSLEIFFQIWKRAFDNLRDFEYCKQLS